jgi:shikimate kinase
MPGTRHLLLVGLSGSGKSTVGQLVADGLGATLFDIDQLLVRQMGMPVAQMFGMLGEPEFRRMERDAVAAAWAAEGPSVIVPGAGWAAQPGQMEAARPRSLTIYLSCTPEIAARRVQQGEVRPLLVGGLDPEERLKAQLKDREPFYRLADYEVATAKRTAAEVATEVTALARRHGGW